MSNQDKELVRIYIDLIKIIKSKNQKDSNNAFDSLESLLSVKMKQICFKISVPGLESTDVYQEALYALRFKAVKDYDETRGANNEPYPFDKFAILCIKRHLFTKRKSAYQNKTKAMTCSVSLDQDCRNDSEDTQTTSLSEIVPRTEGDVLSNIGSEEYCDEFRKKLIENLSDFEKEVLYLYLQKFSYKEMAKLIMLRRKKQNKSTKIKVKSIDNTLSRIKKKAKSLINDE